MKIKRILFYFFKKMLDKPEVDEIMDAGQSRKMIINRADKTASLILSKRILAGRHSIHRLVIH
jgi:hypothetical protein